MITNFSTVVFPFSPPAVLEQIPTSFGYISRRSALQQW
jgi:hypothetical protein